MKPPGHERSPRDEVAPELAFRFQHGPEARSLAQMRDVLLGAPASVAWYHRGHYAAWVREVLRDDPLARRFEGYAEHAPDADVYREIVLELVERRLRELGAP